jgi:hypothetical protein
MVPECCRITHKTMGEFKVRRGELLLVVFPQKFLEEEGGRLANDSSALFGLATWFAC